MDIILDILKWVFVAIGFFLILGVWFAIRARHINKKYSSQPYDNGELERKREERRKEESTSVQTNTDEGVKTESYFRKKPKIPIELNITERRLDKFIEFIKNTNSKQGEKLSDTNFSNLKIEISDDTPVTISIVQTFKRNGWIRSVDLDKDVTGYELSEMEDEKSGIVTGKELEDLILHLALPDDFEVRDFTLYGHYSLIEESFDYYTNEDDKPYSSKTGITSDEFYPEDIAGMNFQGEEVSIEPELYLEDAENVILDEDVSVKINNKDFVFNDGTKHFLVILFRLKADVELLNRVKKALKI